MHKKVLIANRAEIACRVIDTCQRLGIKTVAIYSEADRHARHVRLADEAYLIGPAEARHSYLRADKILAIAKQTGCDAVHPGYGFMSENAEFARACAADGIAFIGPSPEAIIQMGSKSAAKIIMAAASDPMLPGYHGDNQTDQHLFAEAEQIGYPLLVKAVFGGGGKGMRIVEQSGELLAALGSARREALSSFGNDTLLLEKYLRAPRHIEVQIFADQQGHCVYLGDRDCSVQRRHQKVIEEAPAPGLSDRLRRQMGEASIKAALAIDYVGAGTVEYLLDSDGRFYFMEMNTRLQVEHPVTESICGVDLVQWQLMISSGQPLPLTQQEVQIQGHSIEARLYAEDPDRDFMPMTGKIEQLQWPSDGSVRIDTGVLQGDSISRFYDPMIAKIITFGRDRTQACHQMSTALNECRITGLTTNLNFLQRILRDGDFCAAKLSTNFISEHADSLGQPQQLILPAVACAAYLLCHSKVNSSDPWDQLSGFRLNSATVNYINLSDEHNNEYQVELGRDGSNFSATINGRDIHLNIEADPDTLFVEIENRLHRWQYQQTDQNITLLMPGYSLRLAPQNHQGSGTKTDDEKALQAPMNGTLTEHLCQIGDRVDVGSTLVVMEAMKMEYSIKAPFAGIVTTLPFAAGDNVTEGMALVELKPLDEVS